MKKNFNWLWGTFMLLAAMLVLYNQLHRGSFYNVGALGIVAAFLAVAFFVQCAARLSFAPLPFPIAVLYILFHKQLGLPYIAPWALGLTALLACIGLNILLPRKHFNKNSVCFGGVHTGKHKNGNKLNPGIDNDRNPSISADFGGVSQYLHSDCLETIQLHCNFGAIEVFFDQAQLSPYGAVMNINCNFGGIEIVVPRHWQIIDKMSCTLGGVEIDNRFDSPCENPPLLTLTGSVTLGGIEVKFV
ncbi:MAG: cell wall-active antibiotics response protein [Oscillospiraceae bacterium]|nr:cell wall-active antibiotics response protein [Oscillospiraceae bacterium]